MQSDKDLQVMIIEVEKYIKDKTGKSVQIVFNNMQRFPQHFDMLLKAYEFVRSYKNTNN
jgi:hypothetical protein